MKNAEAFDLVMSLLRSYFLMISRILDLDLDLFFRLIRSFNLDLDFFNLVGSLFRGRSPWGLKLDI